MADPLRSVVAFRQVPHPGGGPTQAAYFWSLRLECGHQTTRTAHAKIPKRVRCQSCFAIDSGKAQP